MNLRLALRSIMRRWKFSLLNIGGLGFGLACCLLIYEYVAFERSFDTFNEHSANVYQVVTVHSPSGDNSTLSGHGQGAAFLAEAPGIKRLARIHPDFGGPVFSRVDKPEVAFTEERVLYADPDFMNVFTYSMERGNGVETLGKPGRLLLTTSAAQRYFGTEDPIGKQLKVSGWVKGIYTVDGVMKDIPTNSQLQFAALLPLRDLLEQAGYYEGEQPWTWQNFLTYVELEPSANPRDVEHRCAEVLLKHRKEHFERMKSTASVMLQPLLDVHLNDAIWSPFIIRGSQRTLTFFSVVGLLTLLIALINYINLASARALERAREVGIRKIIGAHRRQLVWQFLAESALVNLAAILIGIAGSELVRPYLNQAAGTNLPSSPLSTPNYWLVLGVMFGAGSLIAGLYPASVLSSFNPGMMVKGRSSGFGARRWLRQGLVILQFATSVALIIGALVVQRQVTFMREMDIGMNLDQVLALRMPSITPQYKSNIDAMAVLIHEVERLPGIVEMSTSSAIPGQGFDWYSSGLRKVSADPSTGVRGALAWVDSSFAKMYGIRIIAGRGFGGTFVPGRRPDPLPVLINETAMRGVGIERPEEAINQRIILGAQRCMVIGVMKDFNWSSVRESREAALFAETNAGANLSLRVRAASMASVIEGARSIYARLFPGNAFTYSFVDERFAAQYENDERFGTLFNLFAALAISIACLGLFGLAAFAASQRTKELGIRKILGATIPGLVANLSREFMALVLAANLIAWPIAYVVMQKWLQDFAYRIDMDPLIFGASALAALAIAFLTVSVQTIRAASSNPVEALRCE